MAGPKFELTQETLRRFLFYDPETGVFTWRERTSNRIHVGRIAGTKHPRGEITIGRGLRQCGKGALRRIRPHGIVR